jgi:S-adenosylmethionine:tRNA ribosyltransferase-isomerase
MENPLFNAIPPIPLSEYNYELPAHKIAIEPAAVRSNAKLLYANNGVIQDRVFSDINLLLPSNSLLVLNDTKVIPARLIYTDSENKTIEIFLLKPLNADWSLWECTVGNRKKFKSNQVLTISANQNHTNFSLNISWHNREKNLVFLFSNSGQSIPELLEQIGKTPLPPYIKRPASDLDKSRYQTVFANQNGAVAAPTASLHFTKQILTNLQNEGHQINYLTLHVGAGTFKPVTAQTANLHTMHAEEFRVSQDLILSLLENKRFVVAAGTTAMRTLESIYYLGAKLLLNQKYPFVISQYDGYIKELNEINPKLALEAASDYCKINGGFILGSTSLFIVPGFRFKIVQGLITNFHQPGSSLLLLVGAFLGKSWNKIYNHALNNEYRFLSYGDASFLIP